MIVFYMYIEINYIQELFFEEKKGENNMQILLLLLQKFLILL